MAVVGLLSYYSYSSGESRSRVEALMTLMMRMVLAAIMASPCLAYAFSAVEQLEQRAALDAAVAASEHARAVELADELVRVQPDDPALWYQLGRSASVLGEHQRAIDASRRAWDLGYYDMPSIALRIARSAAALERQDDALDWLGRALEAGLEDRQSIAGYKEFEGYADEPRFRQLAGLGAHVDDRAEGMRSDIDLLVVEARRLHPAWPERGPRFEAEAARLKQVAPDLGDRQYLFGLMELVTLLGDGHSWVAGPREGSPLELVEGSLPVLFYLFEEGLFVVDGADAGADLVGRRVTRIGRRTPEELLEYSRTLHGAENAMTMRWLGVHFYFPQLGFLLGAGAIDEPGPVAIELAAEDGKTETVTLEVGSYQFPRKLRPVARTEPARYLSRIDTNYWFEALDDATVYFQFNQVRDAEGDSIGQFADRLGEILSREAVRTLIVDVRHNNGGNNGLLRPLLREITAFDVRDDTTVFVITGRGTFSAAQNFINRLERLTDAIFVGEPSSSSPNFIGEETELVLPWSGVMLSISSRLWSDSEPSDARPWIAPQVPVPPRATDYFAGRDAALEAIVSLIEARS